MAPRERGCNQTLCYGKYTFVLYLHSLSFYTYIFVVGPLSKLAYTVHISSAEGYTKYDFCILCGINSKHSDILKKKGGYILKIITKLYVSCNDDTTSFCYKSLITILVVMMIRRRRWTVMIWNILRMLLTI
jgi:hypothetical protein